MEDVRPCCWRCVAALRRFLPAASLLSQTNGWLLKAAIKPSKCYRDKPRLRVAANHTLCSDVLETAQRPLAAVGETVHCPAVAAADSSREQTDRPTAWFPSAVSAPPPPPPPPHISFLHLILLRIVSVLSSLHPILYIHLLILLTSP